MKNWHSEKITINDTNINHNNVVPITELMKFIQLTTFNHANKLNLDHATMQEKSNAFWVVTKMKLVLNGDIKTGDKICVTTWTHELGMVRALRDCVIKLKNSIKVKATAEWCCLDFETKRIRKMNTIQYPNLEMEKTNNLNTVFTNMRENVDNKNFVYSRTIRSTDIDINHHTNNMKYNEMVLDAFSVEELSNINIKEYEIYFVNQSYETNVIDIYKKKIKNHYYIEGRIDDTTIFKSVIKFTKKKER